MHKDAKTLALKLSQKIDYNNSDEMLWAANNELDYFKS